MENNLTICIEKLSLGIIPQQPFLLQLIDSKIVQSRIDDRVANDEQVRLVLSDGKHYGSNFLYFPNRNHFQSLPTKNSIIKIYKARSFTMGRFWIVVIDNFEVVAESHGRVKPIGNPFFPMTDPRGHPPVD